MELCCLRDVTKTYTTGEVVTPLEHLDFQVNAGELAAISGASGIGKTTLLMLLGGLTRPTEGQVLFRGQSLQQLSPKAMAQLRRQEIGYMFQQPQYIQALTVRENLCLAEQLCGKAEGGVDAVLAALGLQDRQNSLPCHLSGGQKRRLMLAILLLKDPALLLLDEPTNDLDGHWSEVVLQLLRERAAAGRAVVIVTHDRALWDSAARRYEVLAGQAVERSPRAPFA